MTIHKAIELLAYAAKHNKLLITNDEFDALRLGIEALKRLQAYRRNEIGSGGQKLPGETER